MNKIYAVLAALVFVGAIFVTFLLFNTKKPQTPVSQAEQKIFTIGILSLKSNPSHQIMVSTLKSELLKTGLTLNFLEDDINTNEGFSTVVQTYVQKHVDMIVATSTPGAKAAMDATNTIPIVFGGVGDPIANGIVQNLDSSGSNITGISSLSVDLTGKRLDIMHDLFPAINKVYFIYQPNETASENSRKKFHETAKAYKIDVIEKPVNDIKEIHAVARNLRSSEAGAILLAASSIVWTGQKDYIDAQNRERIPVVGVDHLMAQSGALFSYGPNYVRMGEQLAGVAKQVLDGTPPQYIPIRRPDKVELIINKSAADKLGIVFSADALKKADTTL